MLMSRRTAQTQGRNIRHYSDYLTERARAYRETKRDWVRTKEDRLEKLSVEKGLLRETEAVQNQLTALLKCDVSYALGPASPSNLVALRLNSEAGLVLIPNRSWTMNRKGRLL